MTLPIRAVSPALQNAPWQRETFAFPEPGCVGSVSQERKLWRRSVGHHSELKCSGESKRRFPTWRWPEERSSSPAKKGVVANGTYYTVRQTDSPTLLGWILTSQASRMALPHVWDHPQPQVISPATQLWSCLLGCSTSKTTAEMDRGLAAAHRELCTEKDFQETWAMESQNDLGWRGP